MSVHIQGDQIRAIALGVAVEKAGVSPANGTTSLFTVTGHVLLRGLYGVVTTALSATATSLKIAHDPTIGSAADLCASTLVTSDAAGTIYGFDGQNPATGLSATLTHRTPAAVDTGDGGGPSAADAPGTAYAPLGGFDASIVLAPGVLGQVGTAANTGVITWRLLYVPLDAGSSVVAA